MDSLNGAALTEKVLAGERISFEDALELYRLPLEELGALADERRRQAKRSAYKGRYGQESVMRVDGISCVSF